MKRFWTRVEVVGGAEGHQIHLDERPVRTPDRAPLILPTVALAEAVAEEWRAVGDAIDPRAMRLTGIANAAIDLVAPDPAAFARPLAAYADSDLLCYRADTPDSLVAAETAAWDPLIAWAETRFGVRIARVIRIAHTPQPPATVARLAAALAERPPFRLAALAPVVTIGGSLILALALDEGAVPSDAAWDAATLDERWQEQRWGSDADATAARAARRADWDAADRMLMLLR